MKLLHLVKKTFGKNHSMKKHAQLREKLDFAMSQKIQAQKSPTSLSGSILLDKPNN